VSSFLYILPAINFLQKVYSRMKIQDGGFVGVVRGGDEDEEEEGDEEGG